jgi:tetratricopeptide (TPR) repeat protein
VCTVLLGVLLMASPLAQAQGTARIHGFVTNPAGLPITQGEVRLSTDRTSASTDRKYSYTFPIGSKGSFVGRAIVPGDYIGFVFQNGKSVDFLEHVVLAAGDDKVVNFDMTRQEYINQMSPEDRKALEDYKAKSAQRNADNAQIGDLNALLTQARANIKAGKYSDAVDAMLHATGAKPDEAVLWITLGDGWMGQGDSLRKTTSRLGPGIAEDSTPIIEMAYHNAAVAYQNGINLNAASRSRNAEVLAAGYNQLGLALGKGGDLKGSTDSFNQAARARPESAGMYFYNETVILYDASQSGNKKQVVSAAEIVAVADKTIAVDPKKVDVYYIKAKVLSPRITTAGGRRVAPPGLIEACNRYLELAPQGPRVSEMKEILAKANGTTPSARK